jgi:hypothetical protein
MGKDVRHLQDNVNQRNGFFVVRVNCLEWKAAVQAMHDSAGEGMRLACPLRNRDVALKLLRGR